MKIGIIMIFRNNVNQIDKRCLIEQINSSNAIQLCFVNNDSNDSTLSLLQDIKDACSTNVSIVEVKKHISNDAAKRAGARYMFNQYNLKHIGFINVNTLYQKGHHLNTIIRSLCLNQELLIDHNLKIIKKQAVKRTLFKSIFSVADYLTKIQAPNSKNQLNPSV